MSRDEKITLLLLATFSLVIGISIYLFSRSAEQIFYPGNFGFLSPFILSGWIAVESLFEICHIPHLSEALIQHIPARFYQIPNLENSEVFIIHRTYDPLDIVFIMLSVFAAFLTLSIGRKRSHYHEFSY